MSDAMSSEYDRQEFKREVVELAQFLKTIWALPYSDSTPALIHASLLKIDKALTVALQTLVPLDFRHQDKQDIEINAFNWPLAIELSDAHIMLQQTGKPTEAGADFLFPSKVVRDMVQLRDAARYASSRVKPKRGNSARRTPRSAQVAQLGKNFVLRFRQRFGCLPPMSATGWVVDLMASAFSVAGIEGVDAADVLRRQVEKASEATGSVARRSK